MSTKTLLVLAAGSLLAAVPASAHHSFAAEFDRDRPITITGEVTLLEWTNPHARLYVDETNDEGGVVRWDLELGPPTILMREGWRRDSLVPGTVVTVDAFESRTETHVASVRTVALPDGRRVFAGDAFDTTAPPPE